MAVVSGSRALLISSSILVTRRSRSFSFSCVALPIPICSDERKAERYNKRRLLNLSYFVPSSSSSSSSRQRGSRRACSSSSSPSPHAPTEIETETETESVVPSEPPIKEAAGALDIRVGRILKAWRHPEADSLYVEEVDVGEPQPRTICSGLVNYIPLHQLQESEVVVLANLKPRNMRGIKSNGMLMAASDASHEVVELLKPPQGSTPGERIWFGAEEEKEKQPDAATPNQVQKKKIWESVQPHLKTTDACVAVLGTHPMRTSAGVVTSTSLKNANIS